MTTYNCIYCNRNFYFKDLFDKHEEPCKYIHKSRRDKRYEQELIEKLPTPQEMYKLIQEMMHKIKSLEEDVLRLKNNTNCHTRKNVANILNSGPTQNILFSAWIRDFTVTDMHLEKVFNFDFGVGGGYFRLLPYTFFKEKMEKILKERHSIFYLHPWELDINQPKVPGINRRIRFTHYVNLYSAEKKVKQLLTDFECTTVADILNNQ